MNISGEKVKRNKAFTKKVGEKLEANSVTAVQQPHHMGDVMDTKDPFRRMVIIFQKSGLVQQM
jgi:hypothetical protein